MSFDIDEFDFLSPEERPMQLKENVLYRYRGGGRTMLHKSQCGDYLVSEQGYYYGADGKKGSNFFTDMSHPHSLDIVRCA